MKISCKKEEFSKGMHIVQSAISSKSTLPILTNIMIETTDKEIVLSSTNLELSVTCVIKAEISKPGATTIPGRKLFEIVRELPSKEFDLEVTTNNQVKLTSKNAVYKLVGMSKEDFPVIPQFSESSSFSMKKDMLEEMIRKTRFSVSTDETRYVLCGIYMSIEKGKIKMVSTDGRRLSFIQNSISVDKKKSLKLIIPNKAVVELMKILEQLGDDINVSIDVKENQISFKAENITITSRLIDGQFPNYEQVIPKESKVKLTLKTEDLLRTTRRVALMSSEKSQSVKYSFSKKSLVISAKTQDMGEAQDKLDVSFDGEDFEIGYNPVFIIDVLNNIGSEEVTLELTNSLNPCVIKPSSGDYLAVIMPMRV